MLKNALIKTVGTTIITVCSTNLATRNITMPIGQVTLETIHL